jgi:DNA-binding response OmpR family regulator
MLLPELVQSKDPAEPLVRLTAIRWRSLPGSSTPSIIEGGQEAESPVAKILIVDDEPNIREVVSLYLRRDGHSVIPAADGEEALRLYRQGQPDLVVLDLMLPKVSGLEVCRRIQADQRVPVVMLTARSEE